MTISSHVSLSRVVDQLESGTRPKGGVDADGEVPSLGGEHIGSEGRVVLENIKRVSREFFEAMPRGKIRIDDILIVKDGATTGKTALIDAAFPFNDAAVNEHVFRLAVRRDVADPRFVFHFLKSPLGQREILKDFRGATVGGIGRTVVDVVQLPLPPLPEQHRIADMLDKADAIRRKRKEAIALTEELLRSTFLDMVGPGAADYSKWDVRSVESLASRSPNSLRTGPFGSDLLHSEFVDAGVAVLGIDNAVQNRFSWGERRFITLEKYDRLRRYTVFPGDVIVTIMGTTGRSAVVPDDIPTSITTKHLATITLDRDEAEPEFVSQALFRHPEVLRQIVSANRGAIMNGLNLGLIKSLRLPVPPLSRQRQFARATTNIRALAKRLEGERDDETLFNSLMARAFSGQFSEGATRC
jgi:type I restriction enzyme, S subunit